MEDAEEWFRRGDELADEGDEVEAEALLRAAVAGGHGAAKVRLAVFLLLQYSGAGAGSHAEALGLLGEAVAGGVPGARNMLGVTLWDDGVLDEAEGYLRDAVAEGDPDASVNLALLLHQRGADGEAFGLLRRAAEGGDGPAYWIVMEALPSGSRAAREITVAYEAATLPEERPVCVRLGGLWRLDPAVLPAD